MLLSHQYRFLFVHVPKTAGISMAMALHEISHHPEELLINRGLSRVGINVNHFGRLDWRRPRVHASAANLRSVYGRALFDAYFKFAFVRNPWGRMVSYFHYVTSRDHHHRNKTVARFDDFGQYLRYEARRGKTLQSDMLTDSSGKLLVDFVGRFEHLREDWSEVCRRIGVTVEIPHQNGSSHRDYRSYYDDESAQFVAEHWREDVDRFGYTFDDARSAVA